MAKWLSDRHLVEFTTTVDGKNKICWISEEALEDHFGATTRENAVDALLRHMDTIGPVAARVARATPDGELVVLTTKHF